MTIINMSGGRAGKPPTYQARTITPTAFPTTIQPQTGYDALSSVTVNAPANLLAQNIRSGVNIAGVLGTYEATAPTISLQQKTVTPSASSQTITPDSGYDGLSRVTVEGDSDLVPGNIKSGTNIFGVVGTYTGPTISAQQRTVTPSYFPYTVQPTGSYDYLSSVVVNAPSSLTAGNIRSGVTIAGITGTYEGTSETPTVSTRVQYCVSTSLENGYPIIALGSSVSADTFGQVGANYISQFPGNRPTGCYVRGKWGYYSAGYIDSNTAALYTGLDTGSVKQFFGGSYSWSNTNRRSAPMDRFLSYVANDLGETYFNGTMTCYPYAIAIDGNTYNWLITDSVTWSREDLEVPVDFTYSNGSVSYSISTSDLRAAGNEAFGSNWNQKWYYFNSSFSPSSAQPCLVFAEMLIEI